MARRSLALLAAAPVLLLLAACSPFDQFIDAGATPTPTPSRTAAPSNPVTPPPLLPTGTPTPLPAPAASCTINTAGTYTVEDCTVLSVSGQNVAVTARTVGTLDLQGNGLKIAVAAAGSVKIGGQDNAITAVGNLGTVTINGDRNTVHAQGAIGGGVIGGNDNTVTAANGVGTFTDNGSRNNAGTQP